MNRAVVVGVIFLFVASCVIPISGFDVVEQSNILTTNGKTLYVGGSGPNNYTKIQAAIIDASEGDTVYVYDDSSPYYQNFKVDKSINLIGEDKNTTIIDGNEHTIVDSEADNIMLRGFTLRNALHAVVVDKKNNIIYGNIIKNGRQGIFINWDGTAVIEKNIFQNNEGDAIYSRNSNIVVKDNEFTSNSVYLRDNSLLIGNIFYNTGLSSIGEDNVTVLNNFVNNKPLVYLEDESDKTIDGYAGQVFLHKCKGITVQNNDLSNTCIGIRLTKSDNCIISNNNISNNEEGGIELRSSYGNNVTGNSITSMGSVGLKVYRSDNNIIIENSIITTGNHGLELKWSDFNRISKNTVSGVNKKYCISLEGYEDGCHNNIISSNTLTESKGGIHVDWGSYSNIISKNHISRCKKNGIYIDYSNYNIISKNHISRCKLNGIFIEGGSLNIIRKNNFINNLINAFFLLVNKQLGNIWIRNYWSRPRVIPKPIVGLRIFVIELPEGGLPIPIPWIQFDLLPALKPYDIEE